MSLDESGWTRKRRQELNRMVVPNKTASAEAKRLPSIRPAADASAAKVDKEGFPSRWRGPQREGGHSRSLKVSGPREPHRWLSLRAEKSPHIRRRLDAGRRK